MVSFIYPSSAQITAVTAIQLPYKTGLLKLFKSAIAFTPELTAADLTAIECDFTGYAAITFTTLPVPFLDGVRGGTSFQVPTQQFNTSNPTTVGNDVYGGWFETAANAILMAFAFAAPWPMQSPNSALPLDALLNFFGSNEVYVNISDIPQ